MRAIIERLGVTESDLAFGSAGMAREVRQLQSSDVVRLFELLERTGGGVASDLLSRSEMRRAFQESLERLEHAARWLERLRLVPMGEVEIDRRGVDLLGAVENSLALVVYGEERERELCASSQEIYSLLREARDDHGWTILEPNQIALPLVDRVSGEIAELDASSRIDEFLFQIAEAARFYDTLRPDGRVLDPDEHKQARRYVVAGALCMRRLRCVAPATELAVPGGQREVSLRATMAVLRGFNRGLILALSDRPERRQQAVSPEELYGSGGLAELWRRADLGGARERQ